MKWTSKNIADQSGKSFLITGANTGLGFESARALAEKSAHVILAGRNKEKLNNARDRILSETPNANLSTAVVDLNSIASVKSFAEEFLQTGQPLDVLINNAGIMFPPPGKTVDGFESQFGVNFVGHYVLTALLFPLLEASPSGRVVTLSSIAHRDGIIDFDNLKLEKPFNKFREYSQSKVADLLFMFELQRRADAAGRNILSVACHPGISKTELLRSDQPEAIENFDYMDAHQGAFPTLFAATEDIEKSAYIGPDGPREINGYPAPAVATPYAKDPEVGAQLWEYAARETGITFPF